MSYCKGCGAYMPDWAEECPACGEPREEKKKRSSSKKQTGGPRAASAASASRAESKTSGEYHYTYKKAERKNTASGDAFTYDGDDPGTFNYDGGPRSTRYYAGGYKADAKKNRGLAALCYLGPFFLLSWLLKPKSAFVRYHVNQGLVLFLCEVIINIFDFIPFMWVANILSFAGIIIGASNALKGRRRPLPIIGDITLIN